MGGRVPRKTVDKRGPRAFRQLDNNAWNHLTPQVQRTWRRTESKSGPGREAGPRLERAEPQTLPEIFFSKSLRWRAARGARIRGAGIRSA